MDLTLADFSYPLPPLLIATKPTTPRDHAKLLKLSRQSGSIIHYRFDDLRGLLKSGDVLVLNQSKVFPARLLGKKETGGKAEVLLLTQLQPLTWRALVKPGLGLGNRLIFKENITARVMEVEQTGEVRLEFQLDQGDIWKFINAYGTTPLPPYIHTQDNEAKIREDYQTVYARATGSAAAPTAGMHFTKTLLTELVDLGIQIEYLTLHVGLGTFQRLRHTQVKDNQLHEEEVMIDRSTYNRIITAKQKGQRIIAVGTTSARALESAQGPGLQTTTAFYYPPHRFRMIDGLVTNFHLPESSLLMMVSAFCSAPNTKYTFRDFNSSPLGQAYKMAIANNYRFFSFGDAMLII